MTAEANASRSRDVQETFYEYWSAKILIAADGACSSGAGSISWLMRKDAD